MSLKSSKSRSDSAVQGTNDSSILSKCSAAKCCYFTDPYLQHFVAKQARRAPLINRGYYVRAKALETTFSHFFRLYGHLKNQILCLGCGFDSGYFRLKSQDLLENTTYVEVDFIEVAERKKCLIQDRQALKNMLDPKEQCGQERTVVLDCGNYKLLGVDMTQLQLLEETLLSVHVDFNVPTLIISEVVITYMSHRSATRLLYWAAHTFCNAAFVMYEQIIPHDAFGQFMQTHFNNLGSTLKSINTYPCVSAHKHRAFEQGWTEIFAVDMNKFCQDFLSVEERARVEHLEPFDEYEEFYLKCSHYFLMVATRGICNQMSQNMQADSKQAAARDGTPSKATQVEAIQGDPSQSIARDVTVTHPCLQTAQCGKVACGEKHLIRVFGHATCVLSTGLVVVIGGFGEVERKHARWQHVALYDPTTGHVETVKPRRVTDDKHPGSVGVEVMYHSATLLQDDRIVILGGRTSPAKPCTTLRVLHVQDSSKYNSTTDHDRIYVENVTQGDIQPVPCWRHSATRVLLKGEEQILLYGGRNDVDLVLNQCFLLNPKAWSWSRVEPTGSSLGPRHSHSAMLHKENVVICGGLDAQFRPTNSVHFLNIHNWEATNITIPNLIPRFSHACVLLEEEMILVGGVSNECPPPGCAVINLKTLNCVEHPLPVYKKIGQHNIPVTMLHNHTAHLHRQIQQQDTDKFMKHELESPCVHNLPHNEDLTLAGSQRNNIKNSTENSFSQAKSYEAYGCTKEAHRSGHLDIVVIGGGGNCFSFGTHLNDTPVHLTV